ncbi:ABC transporter substrate-binding protein [Sporolactobacillus laevolacticus]|uniref:ABC transporter substrate-binding protein n=1 Tax=Sporolactobacillus laevolacticus TaxID=33018 RepID=UPI0025B2887E|nr:ABC transporter substrate-binding protein [Sporolactobacillus laevolacticus]MDN3954841.1 ABC transporter substrate-binding protein [Sporolactobacillus laevolacticus]
MRKLIITFFVVIMIAALTACGSNNAAPSKKSKDGGSITLAVPADPLVLNPNYASDRVTLTIQQALFAPLFYINGRNVTPALAEKLTVSKDQKTYELTLKKNLKWHDGKALTAKDVVFTLNSILDKKQNSDLRGNFVFNNKPVKAVALDNQTVKFTLPEVAPSFQLNLEQLYPIPQHVFANESNLQKSTKNNHPIGSGPYQFVTYKSGQYVELKKFNDFFGGKPHLDKVIFRVAKDQNAANLGLQNGSIQLKAIQPADVANVTGKGNVDVVSYPEYRLNYATFNENVPAFKNKTFRQAISYALNREDIIKSAYGSNKYAIPASSIFTADVKFQNKNVQTYPYDLAKAKQLLDQSKVDKKQQLTILYLNNNKAQESIALYFQQQFKKIGLNLQLKPTDPAAWGNYALNRKSTAYGILLNGYIMGPEADTYKVLFQSTSPYNYANYHNAKLDKVWDAASVETDQAKRSADYDQIQNKIADDAVLYPISYDDALFAISKKYGGIKEAKPQPVTILRDLSKLYLK